MSSIETEYFKSLREEIHLRVLEHSRLVWIKVVALAAIISFLIARCHVVPEGTESAAASPLDRYFLWLIPIAASLLDMLIANNLRVINNLGYYIRNYLERGVFLQNRNEVNEQLEHMGLFEIQNKDCDAELREQYIKEKAALWREFKKRGFQLHTAAGCRGWLERKLAAMEEFCGLKEREWLEKKISQLRERVRPARIEVMVENEQWTISDEGWEFRIRKDGERLIVKPFTFGYWEERAAQAIHKYHCYTWMDMFYIWFFTLLSGVFTCVLRFKEILKVPWEFVLAVISLVLVFLALLSLIRSIRMVRRF